MSPAAWRLPLLKPGDLDPVQAQARDGLLASRGADAQAAGFTMELPGGELIGPFNAYLHVPPILQALRDWMAAIQEYGLPGDVQQVAILTVGAAWRSDYEVYAHAAEARHAGVPDSAIEAILAGAPPVDLPPAADVAHRLALALAVDHAVGDDLYADAPAVQHRAADRAGQPGRPLHEHRRHPGRLPCPVTARRGRGKLTRGQALNRSRTMATSAGPAGTHDRTGSARQRGAISTCTLETAITFRALL